MNAVLQGAKGGGNQPHASTEAPDSLHSVARARILDLVSEGPILGFRHGGANPLQDVYLNETPVANPDGSLNFSDVYIDSRSGTNTQSYMPGFPAVENEFVAGVELKSSASWSQAISNLDLTAVRIRLSVPALQKSDSSTGDITGYTVQYKIELSTDGGAFVEVVSSAFTGKTTSKYERTHRIPLPDATTGWTVRVTRLTANKNLATIADTTTIESYTEIIDAKLRYPNSALVGIIIDAQQFSNIPTRAYDLYGRIVSVPSNYNPSTRAYTGVWDGSFKPAWTNNPAWIFYDLATHPRYGLGRYVTAALMNKWVLYSIAQYCDQLVPDGRGGQEPRFTCSIYMQTQADAYKVLNDLASVFRGQMYWMGGAIQTVADMPGDPDYTYSPANVVEGRFQYSGSGRKTRYTVAQVSWNDPDDFGRAKVETVIDRDGLKRYGFQPTPIIAVGCTSKGQAQRLGLWALYTSRLETETVVFKVGADGIVVNPGRIVRVLDPVRAGKRQAGRVHSATTLAVVVDQMPDLVAIGDSLTCTTSDAVTETRSIVGIDGPSKTITVGSPFSEAPAAETMWAVESTTLAAATYRVLSVAEPSSTDEALEYTITALRHNESKFAAVDIGAAIEEPPITTIPSPTQQAPSTVVISAAPTKGAVLSAILLTIQWTPAVGAVKYRVEWRRGNGNWQRLPLQAHLSVDLPSAKPGDYEARVYAIGAGGNGSQATYAAPYTVLDPTDLPDSIAEIQTQANDAKTDSANALQQLAYIASDSELSQGEKPLAIREYSDIITEQALLDSEADEWNVEVAKADYDAAVSALTTYLSGLTTPTAWNNLGGDTDIVGTTWRSKWSAVYSKRRSLLNAILAVSKAENQPGGNLCKTSTYWNGAGSWRTTSGSSDGIVPNYLGNGYMDAKYTGTNDGGTNCDFWERGTLVPCKVGQIFYVSCSLSTLDGSAGGFGVIFLDKDKSLLAYVQANSKGAGSASTFMYGLCTAPANAVYARPWVFMTAPAVGDRIRWTEFEMRNDAFFQPGGGARIADARNLQAIIFANYASGWSGLTFSTSSTSTSCTISASAATLRAGSVSLAYSASSTTVSGSAGVTRTYYLYYDDGNFDGGAQALHATTSLITALSNDYRVLLGSITVTFPTSGTSTGGGGGPCPHEDAWVLMADPAKILPDWFERAKNVRVGDYLRLTDGRAGRVTHSERRQTECVRVHTDGGSLTCSAVAPLELVPNDELGIVAGASSLAFMAKNRVVRSLRDGAEDGARVARIEPIGEGWVQHITCQDAFFWTGDDQRFLLAHHNLKPLNP